MEDQEELGSTLTLDHRDHRLFTGALSYCCPGMGWAGMTVTLTQASCTSSLFWAQPEVDLSPVALSLSLSSLLLLCSDMWRSPLRCLLVCLPARPSRAVTSGGEACLPAGSRVERKTWPLFCKDAAVTSGEICVVYLDDVQAVVGFLMVKSYVTIKEKSGSGPSIILRHQSILVSLAFLYGKTKK